MSDDDLRPASRKTSSQAKASSKAKAASQPKAASRAKAASQISPSPSVPPAANPTRLFVGTSGWAYPTWKPGFYPAEVSAKNFLRFYASQLNSVEVNYTFRKLPSANIVQGWLDATPPSFRFSFKAPQRITHFSRLRDCDSLTSEFIASLEPVRRVGKLGLLLFQLPPNFKLDLDRLRAFLQIPALRRPNALPIAFEFRHPDWSSDAVLSLLAESNAALCVADYGEDETSSKVASTSAAPLTLTSPDLHPARTHASLRLRRSGGYTPQEIADLATQAATLAADRDVYLYLRHEDEPTGALNARALLNHAEQTR